MITTAQLPPEEKTIYEKYHLEQCKRTDRIFIPLLLSEWALSVVFAVTLTPLSWSGAESSVHPHVFLAIFLGAALSLFPIYFLSVQPGSKKNRYIVAISQMVFSTLLIHLTGGRIETHFHIFGSLAFLAFYKDPKVILIATVVTALDHFGRGAFFPQSIYGVESASVWRALEHAAWVIFEDIFLFIAIRNGVQSMKEVAVREHLLNKNLLHIEQIVEERTRELVDSQVMVSEQQQSLVSASRLSSLGEMAAGIAHEINNPLAIISNTTKWMRKKVLESSLTQEAAIDSLNDIDETVVRISKIILGLRNISRDSSEEEFTDVKVQEIFSDVLSICSEKFKNNSVGLSIEDPENLLATDLCCRRVQLSQVLLNLVSNSYDAVLTAPAPKWIKILVRQQNEAVTFRISDSGPGVPVHLREKIFQPFFTTKDIGKGTGLGLSLSKAIIENHRGTLTLENGEATQFLIRIPIVRKAA